MRESGYYWVKRGSQNWLTAQWSNIYKTWYITGWAAFFKDADFSEINETRIKNPDEQ